ncbi:MAG: hypothetical protein HY694_00510 [Deltaproteobacteria bacterium]|nr:hypothetical protein [Deltaproteobacteria bacterium]
MLDQTILAYGREKGFHQQTLERWLKLAEPDQEALLGLAQDLRIGENHLRDLLDWLEEIAVRDGVSLCKVLGGESLSRISTDPRLSRNDKLKRIKEELRRLRFPRLTQIEGEIQKRIRDMKLKPQIQISVPSGLEGGVLTVQVRATSYEELKRSVTELGQALESESVKEIFALLRGEVP